MWVWLRNTASRGRVGRARRSSCGCARGCACRMSSLVLTFIASRRAFPGGSAAGVPVLLLGSAAWRRPCRPSSSGPRPRSGSPSACRDRACAGSRISAATWPTCCRSMPETVDVGLLVHRDLDPLGDRELDGVRVAEGEDDLAPLDRGLVADADDVELLGEALGHALDGVLGQGPGQAVEGPLLALVVRALAGRARRPPGRRRSPAAPASPACPWAPGPRGRARATWTFTSLGTAMTLRPTRDMAWLLTRRCRGSRRPRPRGPRSGRS